MAWQLINEVCFAGSEVFWRISEANQIQWLAIELDLFNTLGLNKMANMLQNAFSNAFPRITHNAQKPFNANLPKQMNPRKAHDGNYQGPVSI